MRELSLHILDLAQNSLTANATRLDILIRIDHEKDNLSITLADNGKGIGAGLPKERHLALYHHAHHAQGGPGDSHVQGQCRADRRVL